MTPLALSLSDGRTIDCPVRRSARARSLRLVVRDGAVELVAPPRVPNELIERFADGQRGWLEGVLKRQRKHAFEPLCVRVGARIPIGEREYRLSVDQHGLKRIRVRALGEELKVLLPDDLDSGSRQDATRAALRGWLTAEAEIHAQRMVARLAPKIGVERRFSGVGIRVTRSRWGSCSSSGKLMFNRILIHAPSEAFEYVVAHELAHLREMNHSTKFWSWVERLKPDYLRWEDYFDGEGRKLYRYASI
jgi:predicted metal-dependent hydrolase